MTALALLVAALSLVALTTLANRRRERTELLAREEQARGDARSRAAELDAIFEAMVDAVVVYDGKGNIVQANAAFRTLMAVDLQPGFLARPLAERMAQSAMRDEAGQLLPAEQWPMIRLLRGEVLTGTHDMDIVVRSLNGYDRQLNVSGATTRDGEGRIIGAVAIYRDVTERRQLERRTLEALHALLAMAEILVESNGDGQAAREGLPGAGAVGQRLAELTRSVLGCERVSITAVDAEAQTSQPVAVVGASAEQEQAWYSNQPGTRLRDYLDAEQVERFWREDLLVVDAGEIQDRILPYGVRSLLLVLMRVGPRAVGVLSLDHGSVSHSYSPDEVTLARTIARLTGVLLERERLLRERAEAQASVLALREANRRMDAFLALASHELKTPLTSIAGNIQIAQRRLSQMAQGEDSRAAELAPLLNRAHRNVGRINRLVDDLLDMARIQADRLQLHIDTTDLLALVRDVVEERRQLDAGREIRLSLPETARLFVQADDERLSQVVLNYLTNALKYAPPERPIDVGVRIDGVLARVWVRDEGPGLSAADRERVWDRFYRVNGVEHTSGPSVGLGLGLYISRTIVERLGGQTGVESAPGAGASFWFTMPLHQQHEGQTS